MKPNGKSPVSTVSTERKEAKPGSDSMVKKSGTKSDVSVEHVQNKRHGKSHVSSSRHESDEVMLFKNISLGPHDTELRYPLVHFWEVCNPTTKTLIGVEMVLIDEVGTAIQDFIPAGRVHTYLPHMTRGGVYRLRNFFGSKRKTVYMVADHSVTVSFSWNLVMSADENCNLPFDNDRFRFHSYEDFEAICDLKGDLYEHHVVVEVI